VIGADPLLQCHCMPKSPRFSLILLALCVAVAFGQTVTANDTAKLISLRQRAEGGDTRAQYELGFMHEYGTGGAQRDPGEALKWYRRAAEKGEISAKQAIAGMYFEGIGVTKDYAEAARWSGVQSQMRRCLRPAGRL